MAVWNVLHVLAMFIAFGLTTGAGIAVAAIAGTGDVRSIRAATRVGRPITTSGGVVLLLGIAFGFATAASLGFSLVSKWLVAAYVLAALIVVSGLGVHAPWMARLATAAAASPDDAPSPELKAIIDDPIVRAAGPITGLLWIAVISLMVLRPD